MGERKARSHVGTEARRGGLRLLFVVGFLTASACSGASTDDGGAGRSPGATVAGIGVGSDPVAPTPARLPPPRPAVISFVTPAMSEPSPGAAPAHATRAVAPTEPDPALEAAPVAVPPGLKIMSSQIDDVMSDLDRLIQESLQLQYALLRLRLRPKQPPPPPEPDPNDLPVGL